eukprot:TRINITY_DN19034_c0_g1_i1.p1 TRINITY_DN19034_c0_g1~~TRINITY_DN19034_c0_g1_i1.p1  ORF type:complete len:104 (+),score=28.74 TRINITY_DN19034_c0_g1_i1:68-379(+)
MMTAEAFSKDGCVTKVCEGLPVVGYGISAYHALSGNSDHAKRAAMQSTESLAVTFAAICGMLVAGPVGAGVGAVAVSSAMIAADEEEKSETLYKLKNGIKKND